MAYSGKEPHGEDPTARHDHAGRSPDPGSEESRSNGSTRAYASAGVDAWTFVDILTRRWHWMFLSGCVLAAAAVFLGLRLWHSSYSVTAQLIRVENEHLTEFFKPQQFTDLTFGNLLRAPELMARVGAQHAPPLSANEVGHLLEIVAVPESEIITVTAYGSDPGAVVRLANLYSTNAVRYTQELQSREATQVKEAIKEQLAANDADISSLHEKLKSVPKNDAFQPNQRLTELYTRLQVARTDLQVLKRTYKDIYPPVQQKQAEIEELEKQIQEVASQPTPTGRRELMPMPLPQAGITNAPTTRTNNNGTRSFARVTTDAYDPSHDFLQNQLFALSSVQMTLAARQRDAETFITKPPGYIRELAPAATHNVAVNDPKKKIAFLGVLGFAVGVAAALALVMLIELVDDRIRTVDDVRRVTRLPVLATLGDLRRIPAEAQANWAFRTWTALQSRLSLSANHGLVCGIISSGPKEGRTTWVELLAQAAGQCGFKVLTIATLPGPGKNGNGEHSTNGDHKETHDNESSQDHNEPEANAAHDSENEPWHMPTGNPPSSEHVDQKNRMALTTSVLTYPAQVTQQLTGKDAQPKVHIPLPGWVWNLERRKEWQTALTHWSRIDNIVILVELPPSASAEAVLLAQNLPNLIYLADGGRTSAADCRDQLQTLRNARCNLVGSVLNREKRPPMKRRFSRWVSCWATMALLPWMVLTSNAQTPESGAVALVPAPEGTANSTPEQGAPADGQQTETGEAVQVRRTGSFSVTDPGQRAAWQQKLTLGPGDVLNFALFGQPDFSRTDVMVGPDGRISYLHAVDVVATGLTIDELRNTIDEALSKYLRSPRTIITPVHWKSKRYYMLGKVVNKGAYVLDRPITIVEAVARAQGLETGLLDINSVDLADLKRSFLVRQGKRADVNFEKLFLEGDLSQNIPIEPNDYLYFAAGNLKEVYVVGEVNSPGPVTYTANTTLIGAITHRSGFTERAYKSHVLVVRGSLDHPLTFVVDAWKGLEARGLDFKLEPKDIIYVSHRPFIRAEDLLELAITGFIQAATSAYAGEHIGPLIRRRIIK